MVSMSSDSVVTNLVPVEEEKEVRKQTCNRKMLKIRAFFHIFLKDVASENLKCLKKLDHLPNKATVNFCF